MSSFRTGGIPGMICPSCSRSHFPFCGRAPSIHPAILPPYAHGRSPLHQHLPMSNLSSPPLLGQAFNRPLSPPRNILGHLPGRQEGFLEPGAHAFHGPYHNALPGHPLPSFYDARIVDRFGGSVGGLPGDRMGLAGGHASRLPMDGRNVAGRWVAEEEREREREIASESEREMLPRWFLDQMDKHGKGLGQPVDRFGAIGARFDRHPVDLLPKSLPGLESRNIYLNGIGEDSDLRRRGDGVAQREDNQIYKGLRRGNDGMGSGVHEMPDQIYEGVNQGYDGMKRGMYERGALDYGIMPGVLKGGQRLAARFEGFEPTQGSFQGVNASFKHSMGESTMSRTNGPAEFGNVYKERNDNTGNIVDDPGLRRGNEYRDFPAMNLESMLRVQKRARMEGVQDVHGPEKGRLVGSAMEKGDFFRGKNESTDQRFFGTDGPLRPLFPEYQQDMQYSNQISKDKESSTPFGAAEQMMTGDALGKKRQRPMSREEELLIEHGLLHNATNSPEIDPLKFESSLGEGKALPPDGSQGVGLPLPGKGNNDAISPAQKAVDGNAVGQKLQISENKGTYHWNMPERGYPAIRSSMEGREQIRDMPVYMHGLQRDLMQGRSVASAQSVWQSKVDDSHSLNQSLIVSQPMGTFQAIRDSSNLSTQHLTGAPNPSAGDRVGLPESSVLKRGGFEEHHLPGHLRPDESLKTVGEPHLDFLQHQEEPMLHKQYQLQQVHFQEERFRSDAHDSFRSCQEQQKNLFRQVQWQQQQQAVSENQEEIPIQNSEPSSRGQITYTQIQHLQLTQAGEQNFMQDGIENKPRGGQSFSGPYGDRLHQNNLQPDDPWPQPLQHVSTHPDMSFQKNRYGPSEPSAHVQKHDPFQHPPPHEGLQNQHLQLHDQQQQGQQRPHQHEQQISKIHLDSSQLQQDESHYQLPQSASAIYSNQHQQKLQLQQGSFQIPNEQFQPQERQHCQAPHRIYEKQKSQEWGSHLQQQTNQEAGQHNDKLNRPMQQQQQMIQIQSFDVRMAHHQQHNENVNCPMPQQQQMIPFQQQPPELYQQLHRHHQQPQVQPNQLQAQQNTPHMSTAGHFEIPHLNAQGGYQLSNGRGELPGMQMATTVTNGQSQPTQASDFTPFAPPLPPLPLPPSPPSSPPHVPPPPPPPPPPPASPSKSSAPPSFSTAAAGTHSLPTAMRSFPEVKPSTHGYQFQQPPAHHGTGFPSVASQFMHHSPFKGQHFSPKQTQEEKTKVVDAVHIFRQPGRATRPDRFVIILRGLPGSGKSYLAKALRDVEVMNGGSAPRIHSMDDYFMAEVEKVEDNETGNSSSLILRAKKRVTKKVMEYCYEPEMEEAYRASMLKAFKKTLEEGIFTFIIVDDRNLRVADFAQFWAIAKRSGYEVYLLEAPYKDPAGCAARNVHSFTADQVQEMSDRWESAPPLYLQLDISSLFHGDNLDAQNITEVEMDTDDMEHDQDENFRTESGKNESPSESSMHDGMSNCRDRWDSDKCNTQDEAKDLAKSKWSDDHDEDSTSPRESDNGTCNALSGLMQAYGKGDRCVHWADQGGKDGDKGFSIGCVPQNKCSLIIGPGPGYNEASNPITDEEREIPEHGSNAGWESKRNTLFLEQLRAEQESFRAVFDRRRHRIGGMDEDDD